MERRPSNDGSLLGGGILNPSGPSSIGGERSMTPNGISLNGVSHTLHKDHSYPSSLTENMKPGRPYSPSRPPTSDEIDAVIAAAMANAGPSTLAPPEPEEEGFIHRSGTPLMTNLLPSAVGMDGRVNLFVGNLPYRVRWQDLKDLFRKAGTVLRADVSLGPDNRSRGYGTVLLGSREDAARAIDRFNGYTWQTRTLEVRPDRLPPEYEAQPHNLHLPNLPSHPSQNQGSGNNNNGQLSNANFGNGRPPPMYPFNNGPPAPPPPPPPNSFGQQFQSHQPPYINGGGSTWNGNGSQRIQQGGYGNGGTNTPIPNQNPTLSGSGNPSPPSSTNGTSKDPVGLTIAPSPLAGALSGPTLPNPPAILERRGSLAPYAHSQTSSENISAPLRGPTPNLGMSRPASAAGGFVPRERDQRSSFSGSEVAPHFPVHIDGLVNKGMGLGPPSNLHDRVVFVSNMPLTMQWQDLKDLLRPAGLIMRADVAQDDNRKPRGYGTALFATEVDASRAVNMFNGREIGGRQIRVYLERSSRSTPHPFQGLQSLNGSQGQGHQQSSYESAQFRQMQQQEPPSSPAPGPRVPWGINTSIAQTPRRPTSTSNYDQTPRNITSNGMESLSSPGGFPGGPTPGPNFRAVHHPGPISMPPFSPLQMSTPGPDSNNPLSPLQMRGLPPMTPSMPGFVFNAFMPETPGGPQGWQQGHQHPFLSPGLVGPFSPGIPMNSPGGFGWGLHMNAAPGGPVDRFNMNNGPGGGFLGGSAALGTPTTTSFPPGDNNGYGGAPGASPSITPNGHGNGGGGGGEYFPYIPSGERESPIRNKYPTSTNNMMPLNAKDRLAATDLGLGPGPGPEELIGNLSIGGDTAPPSPTIDHLKKRAAAGAVTAVTAAGMEGGDHEKEDTRGRYSLDGDRPNLSALLQGGLKVGHGNGSGGGNGWEGGERRASFGDLER